MDIRKKANALRQNGVWMCQIVVSEEWKRCVNPHRLSHLDVVSLISLHTTRLHGNFIVEWLKLAGPSNAKACRGGHLLAPSSFYASSQYALFALLNRAEEVGLRLLDGAEKVWLRFLIDGGVACLAAHDSAEKVWLRHCVCIWFGFGFDWKVWILSC